ncbi:hypothetical protein OPV22_015489 [Ensete ventricosum]|uniref:Uncharacterized protein n=1 Tax=Ensete ventricosum TaxID=4639 RepID=A0AAV8RC22_ENSVE|nr:hypothetical protein OPV22_015489 [Ensete ventricosum]
MEETPPSSKILAGSPAEARAARHRVRTRTGSLSGSASSLSSSSAATSPSASPSPRSSSVPFSWEQRPGIPKAPPLPPAATDTDAHLLLPLPPPARSHTVVGSTSSFNAPLGPRVTLTKWGNEVVDVALGVDLPRDAFPVSDRTFAAHLVSVGGGFGRGSDPRSSISAFRHRRMQREQ